MGWTMDWFNVDSHKAKLTLTAFKTDSETQFTKLFKIRGNTSTNGWALHAYGGAGPLDLGWLADLELKQNGVCAYSAGHLHRELLPCPWQKA